VRTANRGAGLRLAIAKGIVEAHDGRIWADSEPGQGSTFVFTLAIRDGLEEIEDEQGDECRPASTFSRKG
jgi:signal transduction histidine kinase